MDLVSIVVPCFNGERWLGAALSSALGQSWPEVEVLVVDDGSTDASVEVARSFGDRVKVSTGPNRGPSAARNEGLALARGRWIQFLDADDLLLPSKVEACVQAATRPGDVPFCRSATFGGPRVRRRLAWLRAPAAAFLPDDLVVTALRYEIQVSPPLFPAEQLRRIGGFRAELRWLEDVDLNLRLVLAGCRYVPVNQPLVLVRDHADPGRQRLSPGASLGQLEGERTMMREVRDAGRWSPDVARVFADRLAYGARQAYLAGHLDAARDAMSVARSLSPRPRPTSVPLYNAASHLLGLERTERLLARIRRPW